MSWRKECYECENYKMHQRYLMEHRKFVCGKPITTVDELLNQEFVLFHGRTKHVEVIKSMPLRVVLNFLKSGSICEAVKKEE